MVNILRKVVNVTKKIRRTYYTTWYRNAFVKHTELKNVALIESTHGNDFYGHMYYLTKSLTELYPEMSLNIAITEEQIPEVRSKLNKMGLSNVKIVNYLGREYCKLLASAQYLLNDTSFYPFFIKQDFQKYINIWHGTPLKCLGKDDGDVANMGNVQKNFYSADKLVVSNNYTRDAMIESFNLNGIMRGEVVVAPSPRNSVLSDANVREMIRDTYGLLNKEALVYMPTWRGGVSKVLDESSKLTPYLEKIDATLNDNQVLFVKLHPFQAKLEKIDFTPYSHIKQFPENIESYQFLAGTDGLITDYSSIMYDYMNTGKPVVLFAYDKDRYYAERGCYEDIDDYPFPQFREITALCDWLRLGERGGTYGNEFAARFVSLDNVEGSNQLAKYIIEGKTEINGDEISAFSPNNGLDTVLIYQGTLWGNGITSALMNTLNTIDVTKKNYVVFLNKNNLRKEDQWRLFNLPKEVQFFPVPLGPASNLIERIIVSAFLRFEKLSIEPVQKIVDNLYRREFQRLFGYLKPSAFIHYTGYERIYAEMIAALAPTNVKTSIFMHNDMVAEHEAKGKGMNWEIMKRAYRKVDNLVFVNTEQRKDFLKTFPDVDNHAVVVNNFMDSTSVRNKSTVPLLETVIDAPVIISHDDKIAGQHIKTKKMLRLELNRPIMRGKNPALELLEVETAHFKYLKMHEGEHKEGFKRALPANVVLPDDFEMTENRLISLLGLTKSQMLDDLYNPNLKVFVNIGRMAEGKSHDRLINSFVKVHEKYPNTRLIIIASYGNMQKSIVQWIQESGCADAIYFIGGMSNPYAVLRQADAFVFTSLYEALGLVVFEALAVDTDVVTVAIPATNARLQEGNAMVVDNNQDAITAGWLEYLNHGYARTQTDFAKFDQQSIAEFEQLV